MIDILIPTYNRAEHLIRNLYHIEKILLTECLLKEFTIYISDNASTDDTVKNINNFKATNKSSIVLTENKENIGLEKNALKLLSIATSRYVIFLGDDDYLPAGYLTLLNDEAKRAKYGVIIPNNASLYSDGSITLQRTKYKTIEMESGFLGLSKGVYLGHQLSGLFFEKENVLESYLQNKKFHNIYLFIYFIGFVMKRKKSLYISEYVVKISEFNKKDWQYDNSGLITEIFKNYHALYKNDIVKTFILCTKQCIRDPWRLRIGFKRVVPSFFSFIHILSNRYTPTLLKLFLPIIFIYLFYKRLLLHFK